ncbi:hypothetical protein OEB94_36555, partial [Streptomyces sp. ICN988]|uniref:hypothetical protein n=1 Tax=Streptomyces sp. ICN988 TaxID=2983765 RepID=UPI0021E37D5C
MIWSAALPGAVLRVLRTAAGRRALHVALLVGGLFVLGLLCGGRAQAADGAPGALEDTVGRVLDVPAQTGSRPETPDPVVRAVQERVVRPVGDVVAQTVTEGLEGLEAAVQTDVPPSPLLPTPSGPIDAPDLTEVPDVTDLADPIAPSAPSAPDVQDPRTEPALRATADPADTSGAEDRSGALGSPAVEGGGSPAHAAGYGPKPGLGTVTAAPAAPAASARTHPTGIAHTEYAP